MGTLPRIFVSHSQKDHEFCIRLVEDLRHVLADESAVWYDSGGGLLGGDTWWRTIVEEISTYTVFLVVLTPVAMDSDLVNDEIDLAWQQKHSPTHMRILPLLRQTCTIRADLRHLQIIDFRSSRDYTRAFQELLSALGVVAPQAKQRPQGQDTFAEPILR